MDRRNITRMDYERTHGWWVRFQRGTHNGKRRVVSKHFSDGVHGGKRAALREAIAWRDRMANRVLPVRRFRTHVGHGYVRRTETQGRPVFVAWVKTKGGGARQTSRAINTHGVRRARLLAEQWLKQQQRALSARRLPTGR